MDNADDFIGYNYGISRFVILIGKYAFKFPSPKYGYRKFLQGLLANMQEVDFSNAGWPELCPVIGKLPWGFLVIMPRVRVMTEEEFKDFNFYRFTCQDEYIVPVEEKPDSFGWLNEKIVAIDYGN